MSDHHWSESEFTAGQLSDAEVQWQPKSTASYSKYSSYVWTPLKVFEEVLMMEYGPLGGSWQTASATLSFHVAYGPPYP